MMDMYHATVIIREFLARTSHVTTLLNVIAASETVDSPDGRRLARVHAMVATRHDDAISAFAQSEAHFVLDPEEGVVVSWSKGPVPLPTTEDDDDWLPAGDYRSTAETVSTMGSLERLTRAHHAGLTLPEALARFASLDG